MNFFLNEMQLSSEMTDTGIEPVDKITTRPLDQPKDKLGYDQEKPNN